MKRRSECVNMMMVFVMKIQCKITNVLVIVQICLIITMDFITVVWNMFRLSVLKLQMWMFLHSFHQVIFVFPCSLSSAECMTDHVFLSVCVSVSLSIRWSESGGGDLRGSSAVSAAVVVFVRSLLRPSARILQPWVLHFHIQLIIFSVYILWPFENSVRRVY